MATADDQGGGGDDNALVLYVGLMLGVALLCCAVLVWWLRARRDRLYRHRRRRPQSRMPPARARVAGALHFLPDRSASPLHPHTARSLAVPQQQQLTRFPSPATHNPAFGRPGPEGSLPVNGLYETGVTLNPTYTERPHSTEQPSYDIVTFLGHETAYAQIDDAVGANAAADQTHAERTTYAQINEMPAAAAMPAYDTVEPEAAAMPAYDTVELKAAYKTLQAAHATYAGGLASSTTTTTCGYRSAKNGRVCRSALVGGEHCKAHTCEQTGCTNAKSSGVSLCQKHASTVPGSFA